MWNDAHATPPTVETSAPLAGIRVIDLTVALAGPYCTLLLAGLGAEVIKIDAPGGSDIARFNPPYVGKDGLNYGKAAPGEVSLSAMDRHRNKKSITLDLKSEQGRAIFMDLVKCSDVLVENLSEGTAERLGIGYDPVHEINPALIYASISALGDDDAYAGIKGMDIIVQALSGVMEVTGFADGPPCRVGFPVADMVAPHYALSGILAALLYRARTGKGQKIQVNLMDSLVALLALEHFDVLAGEGKPLRSGNNHDRLTPFGIYRAGDGYVAIAAPADAWAHALFQVMDRPELAADERFRTRGARAVNATALNSMIEEWSGNLPAATVVERLVAAGVAAARVRVPRDAFQDPSIRARGAIVPLRHPKLPASIDAAAAGVPIRFSECVVGYDRPTAEIGAHNEDIYGKLLQIDPATLERLKQNSVI